MEMTNLIVSSAALDLVFSSLSFWDIVAAALIVFIFCSVLQRLTNRGPMLWPVMGIIPSLFFHINDVYAWGTRVLIKAGGTFHYRGMWLGGAYGIITIDPSKVKYMLKTRFKNFPKGKYYRERFQDLLGDGIFNSDGQLWKGQRQLAIVEMHSGSFTKQSFKAMQELVHQKLLKLTEKLANSGASIDFQEVLLRFTFDNISISALGVDPGCLELDLPEVPFAKAFEEATELTLLRFILPPFVWKPLKFFGLGHEKRLKESIKIVHDFAEKTVMDRREELNELGNLHGASDLLSRLMNIKVKGEEGEYDHHFPNNFLRDFCINLILAGRDTSSVALAWFFWCIQNNPPVESRIMTEINEILHQRNSHRTENEPAEKVFTAEELNKMVYLQAALSETLRLYPPVPIDFKEVEEDEVFPDGTAVRKGARIFYCIFSMARMESIWGKDCLEFKPERWIKDDGKLVTENQYKYAVFNGGPRVCLGMKFAYMQMKMVAASILLRYEVRVVEGHSVLPKLTTTLYMKNGLQVTLKRRLEHPGS